MYSGVVLRELQIKLGDDYEERRQFLEDEEKFVKIEVLQEDKVLARKLESKYQFEISFYDLLHLAMCKRLKLHLITRDSLLIKAAAENNVNASKPEELQSV